METTCKNCGAYNTNGLIWCGPCCRAASAYDEHMDAANHPSPTKKPHYAETLKAEIKDYSHRLANAETALQEFKMYLNSPKFYEDTTLQTKDALRWLENIETAMRPR
jgi:hypothetical protein